MAIEAQDLKSAMAAQLGVFGTQRYLDVPHYIPAIQGAQRRFNGLVESIFAENKGGEEMFTEITETRVFQTNSVGAIAFLPADIGHDLWTIVAVFPEPETSPVGTTVPLGPNQYLRSDLAWVGPSQYPVRRITQEQIAMTKGNRFMPGNEVMAAGPRRSYAYYYVGGEGTRIRVLPLTLTSTKIVGVSYLRNIQPIQSISESIPYPSRAFQMLRNLALNELSTRQGAKPLYEVTLDQVRTLLIAQA